MALSHMKKKNPVSKGNKKKKKTNKAKNNIEIKVMNAKKKKQQIHLTSQADKYLDIDFIQHFVLL